MRQDIIPLQTEVPLFVVESDLELLRGPYYIDSISVNWNIVSLPVVPEDSEKVNIFPTASSGAFGYDTSYIDEAFLRAGKGYWVKFPASEEISVLGKESDMLVIPVRKGWNLIGTLHRSIDVASVSTFPPGIIVSQFYSFSTSYSFTDTLHPRRGYWIKVDQDGELMLSCAEGSILAKETTTHMSRDRINKLVIRDASGSEQILYFGDDHEQESVSFELPPFPPGRCVRCPVRFGDDVRESGQHGGQDDSNPHFDRILPRDSQVGDKRSVGHFLVDHRRAGNEA